MWAPIDPMGTLEPYFGPIQPMLLIPNGARARDQPSRNVSFQSISRLITLDLAHYQPAMAVCNIRQRAAGSVVPFPKTLHGGGYQKINIRGNAF